MEKPNNGFCKFKKMFIAKGGGGMGCTSSGGNLRLKAIRIYVKSAPDWFQNTVKLQKKCFENEKYILSGSGSSFEIDLLGSCGHLPYMM